MTKKTLSSVVTVWVVVVLIVGGIGAECGSSGSLRSANGMGALGFALLAWRAVGRDRIVRAIVLGLLAALFVFFTIQTRYTEPVYAIIGSILDEM